MLLWIKFRTNGRQIDRYLKAPWDAYPSFISRDITWLFWCILTIDIDKADELYEYYHHNGPTLYVLEHNCQHVVTRLQNIHKSIIMKVLFTEINVHFLQTVK